MAETGQYHWSKVDPSIYAHCFSGWAWNPSWCTICVTHDHDTNNRPFAPMQDCRGRRPLPYPSYSSAGFTPRSSVKTRTTPICMKYKYNARASILTLSAGQTPAPWLRQSTEPVAVYIAPFHIHSCLFYGAYCCEEILHQTLCTSATLCLSRCMSTNDMLQLDDISFGCSL